MYDYMLIYWSICLGTVRRFTHINSLVKPHVFHAEKSYSHTPKPSNAIAVLAEPSPGGFHNCSCCTYLT